MQPIARFVTAILITLAGVLASWLGYSTLGSAPSWKLVVSIFATTFLTFAICCCLLRVIRSTNLALLLGLPFIYLIPIGEILLALADVPSDERGRVWLWLPVTIVFLIAHMFPALLGTALGSWFLMRGKHTRKTTDARNQ